MAAGGSKRTRLLGIRRRMLTKRKEKKTHKLPNQEEASVNWTALKQKMRDAATEEEREKRQSVEVSKGKTESSSSADHMHDTIVNNKSSSTTAVAKTASSKRPRDCSNENQSKGIGSKRTRKDSDNSDVKKTLRREDLWFDDVAVDIVGGEVVAKQQRPSMLGSMPTQLITGSDNSPRGFIAMDCEMVGGGRDGSHSMLARCSIVNHHGNVVYDKYVQPIDTVSDYRTRVSGIRPSLLKDATLFKTVQNEVSELIKERILVGHSLQNDLQVLFLSHPKHSTRDTAKYRPFKRAVKSRTPGLKKLAKQLLELDIQTGEHDSVTDAQVAMKLYQLHKFQWEHAQGTQWNEASEGGGGGGHSTTKWLPRGRRAQQKKRVNREDTQAGAAAGASSRVLVEEPFNIMLNTDE